MLRRPAPDEEITKDLIMKHVRSAPPLSRWDAPAPGSKARGWMSKMAGKMSRGDAYWASDVDEYALGGQPTPAPAQSGFASASSITRPAPKEVKPPPQRLQSSVRHMPAPLPFSFESTPGPPPEQPTLRSFASTHLSSLNAMKNLGLPPEPAPGASASRPGVSASSSHKASQVTTSMPTKRKSSQVPSSIPSSIPTNGNQAREPPVAGTSAPPVPLARGTKRLGMGRPAPWGSSSANITKRSKS